MAINFESIKKITTTLGNGFNKIMSSGKVPEGSIFDAAQKLGINNTTDLKGALGKLKQNPMESISEAMKKLNATGFKLGELYSNNNKLDTNS